MPNVTINLTYLMGSPVAGAYVAAKLITPDVLTDLVIPKRHLVDGYTDDAGSLVISLVANENAPVYAYYRVRAWHPLTRQKVLDIAAFIPAQDCNLHETQYLRYPPNVDLRTLPVHDAPKPFPTEDTQYVFVPLSALLLGRLSGPFAHGLLFDSSTSGFVPGTGSFGFLWALASEIGNFDASSTLNPTYSKSWIPGDESTLTPSYSDDGDTGYVMTATGDAEGDLLESEEMAIQTFGGTPHSAATSRRVYVSDDIDYVCEVGESVEVVARSLDSFVIEDGIGNSFICYPSVIVAQDMGDVIACTDHATTCNIFCRAYPL